MSAPIEPSRSMIRRDRISSSRSRMSSFPVVAIGNGSPGGNVIGSIRRLGDRPIGEWRRTDPEQTSKAGSQLDYRALLEQGQAALGARRGSGCPA